VAVIFGVMPAFAGAAALTHDDCYRLALKQSESIAIDGQKIEEAKAHFLQAFGAILPHVSFARSDSRRGFETSSLGKSGFEAGFVFTQTLFSGFKEFAAMHSSRLEEKQREKEKLRAQELLAFDVSDDFYLLLETRRNLMIAQTIKETLSNRLVDLTARVNIGKSRPSEVASTQVQFFQAADDVAALRAQERVARELLEFLTGQKIDRLIEDKFDVVIKNEDQYLNLAALRLDVQAADLAWQASRDNVTIAKGGLLPSVSLQANYTRHSSTTPQSERKWSGVLTIDIPIMEGTTVWGEIKEAQAQAHQNRLALSLLNRVARQEIHDAYVNMRIALTRRAILEKALKAAVENYNLQAEDYKRNVVNNLDVLSAIQSLSTTRKNYIHMVYETKRRYRELLTACGG